MTEQTKPQGAPSQALAAPMPSKHAFKPLRECKNLEEAFKTHEFMERIQASVPQHVQPNRMLRTFVSAVQKAPLLAKADLRTFVGACLTLSQVGLEPNTPLGHAYLIPFQTKLWNPRTRKRDIDAVEINVIFGYPGLLDLSFRSGQVRAVHADVVWRADYDAKHFDWSYGTDAFLKHRPLHGQQRDNEQPVFAYAHATLRDGQAFEVLPYDQVLRIRNRSQGYQAALAKKEEAEEKGWRLPRAWTDTPWVAHEIAMARKTAFRSLSKWLPRSVEMAAVIALDEAQERRRHMDFGPVLDAPGQDYLAAATDQAAAPEDEPSTTDPTAAHGVRTREDEGAVSPNAAASEGEPVQNLHEFEAVLIDQHGEPVRDIPYGDPLPFALDYVALWQVADAQGREALLEYNADALAEIGVLSDSDAARVLREGTQPQGGEVEQNVRPATAVVEPPVERGGKPDWKKYVALIKQAAGAATAHGLPAWAEVQQTMLAKAPPAQRTLAIQAIAKAFGAHDLTPPEWLAYLMRPAQRASAPAAEAKPDPVSKDEQWVTQTLADLDRITTRAAFDDMVSNGAIRTVMKRLQRENKPLFDRAEGAFNAKLAALNAAARGSADAPPPPEPDDPGPEPQ